MAGKKKNGLLLLILCTVLAGFVILYFLLPQKKEEGAADTGETKSITVDEIDSAAVSSLVVEKKGKETYSLVKKKDDWQFSDKSKIPLDADTVSGLFGCLSPVTASQEVRTGTDTDLAQYGLDQPAMTIRVTTSDGKEHQYMLGDPVPAIGGYYGMTSSDDTVYCFAEELYSTFDIGKNSLIRIEELPQIDSACMTRLKIDNRKGSDFEATVGKDGETWKITKPYARALTASGSEWETAKGYFTALAYDRIQEYQSGELEQYGLKTPSSVITVRYYEAKKKSGDTKESENTEDTGEIAEKDRVYRTLQLYIGKSCEDGYYVCEKGSSNVYIMAGDTVENMTGLDAYEVMDQNIYNGEAADLKGYEVSFGGKKISVKKEEYDTYETPFLTAQQLTYSGKADPSVRPEGTKPVLTMVYHEQKKDVTVKYLPYDGTNFYLVDKDGMDYFLADKPGVDDLVRQFREADKED